MSSEDRRQAQELIADSVTQLLDMGDGAIEMKTRVAQVLLLKDIAESLASIAAQVPSVASEPVSDPDIELWSAFIGSLTKQLWYKSITLAVGGGERLFWQNLPDIMESPQEVHVCLFNPKAEDGEATFGERIVVLTPESVAAAVDAAEAAKVNCYWSPIRRGMKWDSDAVDVVIQRMGWGTVVYG